MNPRALVLHEKLSESELETYFDDMATISNELVSRYHEVESCDGLKQLISWYEKKSTDLFREYVYDDFTPSILYRVLSEYSFDNGWIGPLNLTNKDMSRKTLLHKKFQMGDTGDKNLVIELSGFKDPPTASLIIQKGVNTSEDELLREQTYQSESELCSILDEFTQVHPSDVFSGNLSSFRR